MVARNLCGRVQQGAQTDPGDGRAIDPPKHNRGPARARNASLPEVRNESRPTSLHKVTKSRRLFFTR